MNKNDFVRGFICALTTLNDLHDQPTMCLDTIEASGFTKKDFKCICGYDKKQLKKILK